MNPSPVVRALRYFGWGELLLAADLTFSFNINGDGLRFDVLNDFLGMLLICRGTWFLFSSPAVQAKPLQRGFLVAALGVSTFKALADHVLVADSPFGFFWSAWEPVGAAATLVLLNLTRLAAGEAGLASTERASANALRTTCFFQALPTAAWSAAHLLERLGSGDVEWPAAVTYAILLVQFIPTIAFFALLWKAKRDSASLAAPSTSSPRVVGAAVLALLALWPPTLAGELYWQFRILNRDAVCGKLSQASWWTGDGRAVEVESGTNGRDELRVVVIRERTVRPKDGGGSGPPRPDTFKNAVEIRHRYPADKAESGLWIDGARRDLPDGVALVYVSDVLPARIFTVSEEEGRRWAGLRRETAGDELQKLRERGD